LSRFTCFYPNVEFLSGQCLGDGSYNTCYQVCDYCKEYKKIYVRNKPVYYKNGARRKLVSYCIDCHSAVSKGGRVNVVDYKYGGYYEILDAIKNSGTAIITFKEAVMIAFNRNHNVSHNGSGAEPGVSMLKRYLGCYRVKDNNISFDDRRLWEFRYKLQYEEPRVNVVLSPDDSSLLIKWKKDFEEQHKKPVNDEYFIREN
jgi:hypothetical protein